MSVDEALTYVISMGVIVPGGPKSLQTVDAGCQRGLNSIPRHF